MEQDNIENADSLNSEGSDQDTGTSTETVDVETLRKERDDLAQTNRQLFERAKKAEGFVKVDGKWVKAPRPEEAIRTQEELKAKAGELDETQLDYLDLKGFTDPDDIEVIQKVMQRTGQTVRQALKDEYVVDKLKANQAKREVANAMPSNTKRSGSGAMGIDAALARYEATGELPTDFETQSAVINAKIAKSGGNLPPWRR